MSAGFLTFLYTLMQVSAYVADITCTVEVPNEKIYNALHAGSTFGGFSSVSLIVFDLAANEGGANIWYHSYG